MKTTVPKKAFGNACSVDAVTVFRDIEISLSQQCLFFVCSILLGCAVGCFYDIFRIIRIAFRHNAVTVFFEDLLFCAVTCCALILTIFCANYGVVRWFSIFGCFGGFMLYRETVGRAVVGAAELIIGFVKGYIISPLRHAVAFVALKSVCLMRYIGARTALFMCFLHKKAFYHLLLCRARRGFGL